MRKNIFITGVILCVIIISQVAFAASKKRIAILDFSAENTSKTYASAVRNLFEVALHKTGSADILERNQMKSILEEQGLQMTGCTDQSCAVEIGRMLSADMVVMGSLIKMGGYTITVKFVHAGKASIVIAESERAKSENDIQDAIDRLVKKVAAKLSGIKAVKKVDEKKEDDREDIPFSFGENLSGFLKVRSEYLLPVGEFRDLVESGIGFSFEIGMENLFLNNFVISVDSGYSRFSGEKDDIESVTIIPMLFKLGYNLNVTRNFYVTPEIKGGAGYISMSYDDDGFITGSDPEFKTESIFEPMAFTGISFNYDISIFYISAAASYGMIFEKDSSLRFYSFYGGFGVRF